MAISHRTNRLKVIGNPSVEQLQNDRYRLTFNMTPLNPRNDWYHENKSRIFADFGTLSSAEMNTDGINPRNKETYPNMRLVSAESGNRSRVEGGQYIVQFVYETLGSSFVQIKDDTVDEELNGLRRVTRESIAAAGTNFQKIVGTTTITHQIDSESAVTLFLQSYEVDDTDSFRKVEEVYVEAGELNESIRNLSEGVREVTKTFLMVEGSTVGPVVNRTVQNTNGFKTIRVSTLQDRAGNSIVSGGTNLVHSYKDFREFNYPGIVDFFLVQTGSSPDFGEFRSEISVPPTQAKVLATTFVFFQTASEIVQADYTYENASGLWSPNSWASVRFGATGSGGARSSSTRGFRGYRSDSNNQSLSLSSSFGALAQLFVNGSKSMTSLSIGASAVVKKGPPDPIGSKWVLNAKVSPAFEDVDGNIYFKKTIIVTDAIPAQTDATVPFS